MIGDVITVRSRETGDVLSLPGGRKTLKRLMIDRKIPAERRAFLPVLASGGQVLAVYGLGVSAPFLPRTGSPVLVIEFTEKRSQSS